ncbi:hypothetical protein BH09ACT1_BH09ACT1_18240 [soil metagenome]
MKGHRLFAAALLALGAVAVLSACTGSPDVKPSASASTSATPKSSVSATPDAGPALDPTGSAEANKAFFDSVNRAQIAANPGSQGRDFIDSLVVAGFSKADMQVTPDKTSIGRQVDSILFSVKIGTSCLLGQNGGGGYTSSVAPALASGACLIGKTRTIDW